MGIENIDVLKDEPDKHPRNCLCKECIAASEAILNGTDEFAQNFPESERVVKDRRPRYYEGPV